MAMTDTNLRTPGVRRDRGFRRITVYDLSAANQAAAFEGLAGDVSAFQALAAAKRAAPLLGIRPHVIAALDTLFAFTQSQDWEPGRRPVVWPSNARLAEEWQVERTQVKFKIRAMVKAGLIAVVESPNGKRWGRRDAGGLIQEAYGFDLSPMALNFPKFVVAAHQAAQERQELAALRRSLTINRKALVQLAETAIEHGARSYDWDSLIVAANNARAAARQLLPLDELQAMVEHLETLRDAAKAVLDEEFEIAKTDPKGPVNRPHILTTNQTSTEEDVSTTSKKEGSQVEVLPPPDFHCHDIKPRHLLDLVPAFRPLIPKDRVGNPTWNDLVEAASLLRHHLGISEHAWSQACGELNRIGATICIGIIAAKGLQVRSPGGYLRGMLQKHRDGELYIGKSLFGLKARQDQLWN